jgi:hypothetical protein
MVDTDIPVTIPITIVVVIANLDPNARATNVEILC